MNAGPAAKNQVSLLSPRHRGGQLDLGSLAVVPLWGSRLVSHLVCSLHSALTRETRAIIAQMTGAARQLPEQLAPQPENPSHPRLPPSPRLLPRGPNPQPVSPQMTEGGELGPDSLVSSMDTSFHRARAPKPHPVSILYPATWTSLSRPSQKVTPYLSRTLVRL